MQEFGESCYGLLAVLATHYSGPHPWASDDATATCLPAATSVLAHKLPTAPSPIATYISAAGMARTQLSPLLGLWVLQLSQLLCPEHSLSPV